MVLNLLRRFRAPAPGAGPAVPDGERLYAIGDVHGRLDLLDQLLARIAQDDAARGAARTRLILLGDLIDRGPDSRGVVERAIALCAGDADVTVLQGNHEEMMLAALRSEGSEAMRFFIRCGGRETLLSYGISPDEFEEGSLGDLRALALERVPEAHVAFLDALPRMVVAGGYAFVHAGIRPGVALDDQSDADLRWIRGTFLTSRRNHGHVIVHGHSVSESVEECPNRIGIDTGAYASGVLTAIGLEGDARWYLATGAETPVDPPRRYENA